MKYIVYKTTNTKNNYIYIGVHKSYTDSFDGYLGCGVNINKETSYSNPSTKFQKAVLEYGIESFKRETLAEFDTLEDAYKLEGELVNEDFLLRDDVYNMILGGKENHSEGIKVYLYNTEGIYFNFFNSYQDAATFLKVQSTSIRRASLYKYQVKGYYCTLNKYDKINPREFNTNKKIRVYKYNNYGEYLNTFESYNEAARDVNRSASLIREATLMGKNVDELYYYSFIHANSYREARVLQIQNREVHKYSSNGSYICSYDSQLEAEEENPGSNITKSIQTSLEDDNGFKWSLFKREQIDCATKKYKRKVGLYSDSGELLKVWESARACCREVGGAVQNVLNGKYKKHKGNIYRYIDN